MNICKIKWKKWNVPKNAYSFCCCLKTNKFQLDLLIVCALTQLLRAAFGLFRSDHIIVVEEPECQ